jgi:hypothetical protein
MGFVVMRGRRYRQCAAGYKSNPAEIDHCGIDNLYGALYITAFF